MINQRMVDKAYMASFVLSSVISRPDFSEFQQTLLDFIHFRNEIYFVKSGLS